MTPATMTIAEFHEAHRAECRRFFQIVMAIDREWIGNRLEKSKHPRIDIPADLAAKMLEEETPGGTLLTRIRNGTLVVEGWRSGAGNHP